MDHQTHTHDNKKMSVHRKMTSLISQVVFACSSKKKSNVQRRFDEKCTRVKGFGKKILDTRRTNLLDIAKDIDSLIKSEVSDSRSLMDTHIAFLKDEFVRCVDDDVYVHYDSDPLAGKAVDAELDDEDFFEA